MVELTWAQLRNTNLTKALHSLARQRTEFATTLKILNILKSVEAEQKKAFEMGKILSDKYIDTKKEQELSKAGMLDTPALKEGVDIQEYEKATQEYFNTRSKIRGGKINASELSKTEISAIELSAIEMFLVVPEETTT